MSPAYRGNRWVSHLPEFYTTLGLETIAMDRFGMRSEYLRYDTDKCLTSYEEFSRTVLDHKSPDEARQLRELIEAAAKECQRGVAIAADMVVAIARKPGA